MLSILICDLKGALQRAPRCKARRGDAVSLNRGSGWLMDGIQVLLLVQFQVLVLLSLHGRRHSLDFVILLYCLLGRRHSLEFVILFLLLCLLGRRHSLDVYICLWVVCISTIMCAIPVRCVFDPQSSFMSGGNMKWGSLVRLS